MGQTEAEMSPDQIGWSAIDITASPQCHSDTPRGAIFTTVVMKLVSDELGQFFKQRIGDSRFFPGKRWKGLAEGDDA